MAFHFPTPPPTSEPPEFSLKDLIDRNNERLTLMGVSALKDLSLDTEHTDVPGVWRPSSLRSCRRAQVYKALRIPKSGVVYDRRQQLVFDRGHVYGAWAAAYVKALVGFEGVTEVTCEDVAHDPTTEVGGKIDIHLVRNGHSYLVEVKSKEDPDDLAKINGPDIDHIKQYNDYLALSKTTAGWIFYIGLTKTNMGKLAVEYKDFFRRYDPTLWADTENIVASLNWFRRAPERLAPKTPRWRNECDGCPWRGPCDRELSPRDVRTALAFRDG